MLSHQPYGSLPAMQVERAQCNIIPGSNASNKGYIMILQTPNATGQQRIETYGLCGQNPALAKLVPAYQDDNPTEAWRRE